MFRTGFSGFANPVRNRRSRLIVDEDLVQPLADGVTIEELRVQHLVLRMKHMRRISSAFGSFLPRAKSIFVRPVRKDEIPISIQRKANVPIVGQIVHPSIYRPQNRITSQRRFRLVVHVHPISSARILAKAPLVVKVGGPSCDHRDRTGGECV